jgi:hypothetical protein
LNIFPINGFDDHRSDGSNLLAVLRWGTIQLAVGAIFCQPGAMMRAAASDGLGTDAIAGDVLLQIRDLLNAFQKTSVRKAIHSAGRSPTMIEKVSPHRK